MTDFVQQLTQQLAEQQERVTALEAVSEKKVTVKATLSAVELTIAIGEERATFLFPDKEWGKFQALVASCKSLNRYIGDK
jgi:peptidase E